MKQPTPFVSVPLPKQFEPYPAHGKFELGSSCSKQAAACLISNIVSMGSTGSPFSGYPVTIDMPNIMHNICFTIEHNIIKAHTSIVCMVNASTVKSV
jgi:hypothetical protein